MVINNSYFNRINKVAENSSIQVRQKPAQPKEDFGQILKDKISQSSELKFSKHAELRLQSRNINLTPDQKAKIKNAICKAEGKGVKDSLVLLDGIAFVVNTKSKTVITAVNSDELNENVFTNIDGAVVL